MSALGVLLLCVACAEGAVPGAMMAPVTQATLLRDGSPLRQAVQLGTVGGGKETNPLWTSQVSSADFAEALRRSLAVHAILATGAERFRLDANLINLEQPLAGLDMTVSSTVTYRLTAVSSQRVLFEQPITAYFTAAFSSAFVGVQRLRLANEGAIRANIIRFIEALIEAERTNPAAFSPAMADLLPELRRLAGA